LSSSAPGCDDHRVGDTGGSPKTATGQSNGTIFISYARDDDEPFVKRLRDDLVAHGRHVWWDRASMESRGQTFLTEIRTAIESAERVLLVVGPAVKDRPYVEVEWRHALRHGVVVTPVLRLGEYSDVPTAVAALHCEDVREHVPEAQAFERVRRIVDRPVLPLGALVGVPRLPSPYVVRSDLLDRLLSRVLIDAYEPIDLEADQRISALTGMGGVGKSVLATALAQTAEVRRSFQGGVVWIPVGQHPDIVRVLARVGIAVGDDVTGYTDVESARIRLSRALAAARCLVVLDDVWDSEVVEALHLAAGTGVRILMTSRHQDLFASTGVHLIVVDELSEHEGLELLSEWTATSLDKLPPQAREICDECGNLPLALSMVGAMIGQRTDRWDYALARLRAAKLDKVGAKLPDYPYRDLDRAMLVSFEDLDATLQQRYLDLAVLPEDASAPLLMLETWWVTEGTDRLDVVEILDRLAARSLVRVQRDGRYVVHDVQRDFLLARVGDVPALHERWLVAFGSPVANAWWAIPDDGYLLDYLGFHLREAGRAGEWRELLTSFEWLDAKTAARGLPVVLQDFLQEIDDPAVAIVEGACRRAAHVLTNDPAQLAAQLLARILPDPTVPEIGRLREAATSRDRRGWLCPVTIGLSSFDDPVVIAFRGREPDGHAGTPRSIALSPDLSLIASAGGSSNDLTAKLWSMSAATLLWTVDGVIPPGRAPLAFVSAEGLLALGAEDRVSLYRPAAGEAIATVRFPDRWVVEVCRGLADGVVLVAFRDGGIVTWNSSDNTVVTLRDADDQTILALSHARSVPRFVAVTATHMECRQSGDGTLVGRVEAANSVYGSFTPLTIDDRGERAWSGAPAVEWSIDAGTIRPMIPDEGRVVAITPDGRTALMSPVGQKSYQHHLQVFHVEASGPGLRIGNSREYSCLALADTGDLVVTADYEHDIKVWDLTHPPTGRPRWDARGPVYQVRINDDGDLALVVAEEKDEVWNTLTGLVVRPQPDVGGLLRGGWPLSKRPLDEEQLYQMQASLRDVGSGSDHHHRFGPTAASHRARRAVTALLLPGKGADRAEPVDLDADEPSRVWVWDLDDLSSPRRVVDPTGWPTSLAITGDGRHALTGSQGRMLRLWDLDSGTCVRTMPGHRGMVHSCGISDDARLGVSGSEDMTVRLWDLEAGVLLFTFATASAVSSCDISSDGRVAIAGEESGRVHVFAVR
jgi:WD40 repeat protein